MAMTYESKKLFVVKNGKRMAQIRKTNIMKGFVVDFYYDGYPDYEWKRGSHGISCDICDTIEQAKRKANYYVSKEY